jgi:PAS domain S-box-containing protein
VSSFLRLHAKLHVLALMFPIVTFAASRQEPNSSLRFVGNDKIPPILFVQNEKPAGLAVDLAYAIAEKAHLSIRIEAMDWPEAQSLVSAGQADALLQINSSPEREMIYDFSETLLESRFHIFRKNARVDIQNLSSLYGRKVGVEAGGFPIQYLRAYDRIQLVVVPSWKNGFEMLNAEQLDAVFVDRWVGEYDLYLHKIGGVTLVDPPVVTDYSRIAVKKGNKELLDRINAGLQEIERDGTRQRILSKWQAKEVVYVTREWIERLALWAALICVALLIIITQRALAHSRTLKKINYELAERSDALTCEIEERRQAEAALQRAHDTLEQHVAERTAELRQSEERWRLFVEHAPAAIAMFDLQMRYLAVSRRWMDDFQLAGNPVLGRSHYDIFPELPERWKEILRRCLNGAMERAEEDPFTRADGQVQWLRWEVHPWHDAEDRIGGIVIFSEDITERKRAEEEARQSAETFERSFHGNAAAMTLTRREDGRILDVNERWLDLTGLRREEIVGETTLSHGLWKYPEERMAMAREVLQQGFVRDREFTLRHANGREWTALFSAQTVTVRGEPVLISSAVDITARKRAEEALREGQALLQAVLDHLPDAVFLKDAQSRIILANPATLSAIGKPLDQVIGKDDSEHYADPEVGRAIMENDRRIMESGATEVVEEVGLTPDGYRTFLSTKAPWRDTEGRIIGLLGITRDITDRKRAEAAVREREGKYRNLFENMAEEVHFWQLIRDEQGRIETWRLVDANPPALKTWGRQQVEEIRGKTTDEIFGPGAKEHYMPVVQKIMTEGAPHTFEDYFPNLDKYFRFTSVPLGEYFITTGADITAIKKAQEALRAANETLEQRVTERTAEVQQQADQLRALAAELTQAEQRERKRLAKILHDHIQQLLVAARMQVEWMQRDSRPERLRATVQAVDSILKEALDASRSLTVELSPPVLHEAGLIGGLNWLAARTLERNQFEVILRAENKAEPPTEDARLMLFKCARELLLNAVKHSGVTQAHITLLRTNEGHIRLIFSDAGKGFDPDLLKKRRPDEASFGLFSIQQRLIHYGGEMAIATAPGKGTCVTLTLPVGEAPPLTEEPDGSARDQAKPDKIVVHEKAAIRRVLIVDDHKIMRDGLVSLMQFESDIEVVGQAADGPVAIELATKLQPDAIIMDINLGDGMNGVEATRRILAGNPKIKVIGLSMHTDNDVATALRDAGAVACLTKGGPSEDLIAAIRKVCSG